MSVIDVLSWVLLVGGGLIAVVAGIGVLRFPDLFTRMHAASMLDTLGAGCVIAGLVLQRLEVYFLGDAAHGIAKLDSVQLVISFKLLLVFAFLAFTTTTAGHALAKSTIASGLRPKDAHGKELPLGASGADAPEVTSSRP